MIPNPVRIAETSEIPIIDIGALARDDNDARRRVAREITEACESAGFLYIVGHGVPDEVIAGVFGHAKTFFALPEEEKLAIGLANSTCFRGYLPLDSQGKDSSRRYYLEAFQMQDELPADDPDALAGRPLFGPNQWPAKLPGFRAGMNDYFARMRALSDRLLRAFALGLDLEEDFFLSYHAKPLEQLRLLHYPPQPAEHDANVIGSREHCDTGAFTILLQDQVGGLEVETAAGEWVLATPVEGAFVVNIGDMMQTWTNGRFASTRHRVINRSGGERYSVPFFVNPDFDAVVEPLPAFMARDDEPPFEPVHVGAYITDRFESIWPRKPL